MKQYYISEGPERSGPFSLEELKDMDIRRTTMVWRNDQNKWLQAAELPELCMHLPPELPNNQSNTMVHVVYVLVILGILGFSLLMYTRAMHVPEKPVEVKPKQDLPDDSEARKQAALEFAKRETRKRIGELITLAQSEYVTGTFGGISELDITVSNNAEFIMDVVDVEVRYYKKNGKLYKRERVSFLHIKPHDTISKRMPETTRGTYVESSIINIKSDAINL